MTQGYLIPEGERRLHASRMEVEVEHGVQRRRVALQSRFLADARIPVDNNASERALRAAALGRKNWLFVGHDESGANVAGLFSLIATCEANGVNPTEYLADVLMRVQTHPASRIDELLPHNWKPPTLQPSD